MSDETHTWTDEDLERHAETLEAIRQAAANREVVEVARLTLANMEAGTPIVTAYLMLRAVQPLLPPEIMRLVNERLADTGIAVAALDVLR